MSDTPVNETPMDNSYTSRPGQQKAAIPVQSDDAPVEDPVANSNVDPDSDAQLGMHNLLLDSYCRAIANQCNREGRNCRNRRV